MKILIPSEVLPHNDHSIRAANIVMFNLIKELLAADGVIVHFLPVSTTGKEIEYNESAQKGLETLAAKGMIIEEPLILNVKKSTGILARVREVFFPSLSILFPITQYHQISTVRVQHIAPDWIFTIWSEVLTDLFALSGKKIYAYYGNPVPKNIAASLKLASYRGQSSKQKYLFERFSTNISRFHKKIMGNVTLMGNVAKNDADYYRDAGICPSHYIQNTWVNRFDIDHIFRRIDDYKPEGKLKIAASVGKLGGTANTFGFLYLIDKLLPELRKQFPDNGFELHIFGSGEVDPLLKSKIIQPEIVLRGFVQDIDEELMQCPIFLCCNNATDYNVGHTRYLHAWTLGRCVVSHENVRNAMPEIVHNENALLG